MRTKSITIDITLHSNGVTKKAYLDGYAFIESGFLSGKIRSGDTELSSEEKVLLTAFTFTGCPIAARVEDPNHNPWLLTNGSYRSTRTLNLPNLDVSSTLISRGTAEKIHMELTLSYEGALTKLLSVKCPFQEHIQQVSPGMLQGNFELIFNVEGEYELKAEAISMYELDINHSIVPVWRNIIILNALNTNDFIQIEQIDLFGEKVVADDDLNRKTSVAMNVV